MSGVFVKSYEAMAYDRREIGRYMGCREETAELSALLDTCLKTALPDFSYKVCYGVFPLSAEGDEIDLSFMKVKSRSLGSNLKGCDSVILFAATVGIGIDRLIGRYSKVAPSKAVVFQAIGAERIEALCDAFCKDMEKETGRRLKPRFSPGYGDCPLSVQQDMFKVLMPEKLIGLTLNESLLMSPTKSVTAFVGLETRE